MKLKKLIVHGFKSFKDRTTIFFDNGITGIVGPNGCGKSNIVDALFWVMGEQSAKHLRGNSMKDVIFAGSSKYNPGSWAEVSLVLDNDTGKHIHIGNKVSNPSEIQITRKLYRNSETEYRINGLPCRLKDIQEIFMDTGAGAKSYSIIAQGEIDRIVKSKPEERRTMIEEVAGITKFKIRKRESMRKIERTEQNLSRLKDLQLEIEKYLTTLKGQAEKAERARSLKEKIQGHELTVSSHKVYDYLKSYRDGHGSINEKKVNLETWSTRKDTLELELQEDQLSRDEQVARLEEYQGKFNEDSKKLAAAEERLNYLKKSEQEKNGLIQTRLRENDESKEELLERKNRAEELTVEQEALENFSNEDHDFSELEEKVQCQKDELEDKNATLSEMQSSLDEKKEELRSVEQEIFKNSSKLEEYAANLQDITGEIESLENQYSGFSSEISEMRDGVNRAQEYSEELAQKEEELKESIITLEQNYHDINGQYQEKYEELIRTESQYSSLKELADSLEGVNEGATNFLNDADRESSEILGNLIKCDEQYTKPVTTILSPMMDVLVNCDGESKEFFSWWQNNKNDSIDFFVPKRSGLNSGDSEIAERLKLNGCGEVLLLKEIVSLPEKYQEKISSVLEGCYIVENLNEEVFNALSDDIAFEAIVSLDGANVVRNLGKGHLVYFQGEGAGNQSMVARNNKLIELEERLNSLKETSEQLKQQKEDSCENLQNTKDEYEQLRNGLAEAKAEYSVKKSTLDSRLSNFEFVNSRLDILKNRKNEISTQRLVLLEAEEGLQATQDELSAFVDDKSDFIGELSDQVAFIKSSYENDQKELLEKQIKLNSLEDRKRSIKGQIDDVQGQIARLDARIESNTSLIEEYKTQITQMTSEISELEESNKLEAKNLLEREQELSDKKDVLELLLHDMQSKESESKDLNRDINRTEKQLVELEIRLGQSLVEEEQVTRNIFEKYRIDLRDAVSKYLEYTEDDLKELNDISSMYMIETESGTSEIQKEFYEFDKKKNSYVNDSEYKLRKAKNEYQELGEINWQAIEDYERQKRRFDFLQEQENQLRQSLEDLQNAITQIDERSKERFQMAFEEVNLRFEKVFPIIFGGGSAKLRLAGGDEEEPGVDIVAQLPGKKMQNISLMSGGEKAMTAVSLIFSIFLVKPSPFCLLDEVDAPLDDANVTRFNELLREMSNESQFILITHNKKTMEMNDTLYGVTMQEPGISKAVSVQLH